MCASQEQPSRGHPSFLYSCHCSGESHSRAAEIPASDCCHLLHSLWYKGAAVPVTVCVIVPYLPSAQAAAVPWDLQGFFLRELQEQIKSQGLNLLNDSIHAFPFLSTTHPGERSCASVPCQCKDQLTVWPFCTGRVMPSNVPLLVLETDTWAGEIMLLALETLSVQSYVGNEGNPGGRQSAKNCRKTEWDSVGLLGWKCVQDCHNTSPSWRQWRTGQVLSRYINLSRYAWSTEWKSIQMWCSNCLAVLLMVQFWKTSIAFKVTIFQSQVWSSDT